MKFNITAIIFLFFSICISTAQTTTFTTQVCQTKSDGTFGLDRNQWAYDNNRVNEAYLHDFPPVNVNAPCGGVVLTSLLYTLDILTPITDNTDGVVCDWVGVHANLYVNCPGICDVNQQMNGGCNNWVTGYSNPGTYTMDLMDCPSSPVPDVNSTLNVDLVSSMDWGLTGCSCNGTSISSGKADFDYTICIDYEYEVPALPIVNIGSNSPVCHEGTIELTADGGQSYEWDGPNGFSSSDQNPEITDATTLESGTYSVTVTGEPGCETVETINVQVADELVVSVDNTTDPTCYNFADGTANLSATGGVDNSYSYDWFPGAFSTSTVNTLEGDLTYEVTVTDGSGCEGTIDFELTQPDEIEIIIDLTQDPSCFGVADGAVGIFGSGGDDSSYSFTWSPGGFTGDIVSTLSGNIQYQIVLTDGNGCTATENVELIEPDTISIDFSQVQAPKCFGDTSGFAVAVGSGGNGFFDYAWSNGLRIDTAANLIPDSTYGITVTDINGCDFDDTIRLTSPDSMQVALLNAIDPDCGGSNGSATIAASGGTGPLSYLWQPSGITDSVATGLSGGIPYTVSVIDSNNCVKQVVVTLIDAPAFSTAIGSTTDPTCAGTANGSATVTPSGGQGPFRYIWPSGNTSATANDLLGDSTYYVTVLDANDCEVIDSVTLTAPQPLIANINNSMDPTCAGAGDGFASVLIAGGTGSNFDVSWSPGNLSGLTAIGLSGGINYTVTVTDDMNCSTTSSIMLTEPAPVVAAITGDTIFCAGENRNLSGNAGFSNYSWSNTMSGQNISVSAPGTYILTVTDGAGCEGIDSVLVNNYPTADPQIQGSPSFCTGTSTTLELAGYSSYTWSTGGVDSFIMVNTPGQITVDVVDLNGCVGKDTVVVTESSSLNPTIGGDLSFCEGDSTSLSAGSGFAVYNWSNTNNSNVVNITTAGTYSVTVQDATGCTGADTVVVVQNANPTVGIAGAMDFCEGDTIQLAANSAFSTYNWNGTPGNQTIDVTSSGNYVLNVVDANNCVADASVSVNFLPTPPVNISGDISFCEGDTIQLDAGSNFNSYNWSNGASSQMINVSDPGDYVVNIEGLNGCKNADTLSVSTLAPPTPAIQNATNFCEGDSIQLTVGGGVFTQYQWSDTSSGSDLTILDAGAVFVTVTDSDGCEATAFANINTFPNPTVDIAGSSTFCTGNSTTLDAGFGFSNYDWSNGASGQSIMVSNPGFIEVIVTDLNGCKATDTLTVSESASLAPSIVGNLQFCEGDSTVLDAGQGFSTYQWSTTQNAQTITVYDAGTIELTVDDGSGCSGKDTVEVTVYQSVTPTSLTPMICTGQTFPVGTNNYSVSGIYRDTFQNINGCDSLVITDLTVSAALEETVPVQICRGDSLLVGGSFQTQNGTYRDTIQSLSGCDSIVITNLSFAAAIEEIVPVQICRGDSLLVGGSFQTQNGTYRDTIQSLSGCDSIVITDLSFSAAIEETIPVQICPGTSYFAGGSMQTMAGMYRDTFQIVGGCDSVAITNLTITSLIEETIPVELCPGLSYFAEGAEQTTPGMYRDTFQTLAGCDSVAIIDLSFSPITEVLSTPPTLCIGDSLFVAGEWRFETGTYSETQSILGQCDTLFTVNLTFEPCASTLRLNITPASCFGDSDGSVTISLTADLNDAFVYTLENTDNSSTSNGNLVSNSPSITVENLIAGNYTLSIFNRLGDLETTENFVITEPSELVILSNTTAAPTCHDTADGIVKVEASGGTPNYIYEWQNSFTGDERTDLSAGNYEVYVTDDNGCKDTVNFIVTAPDSIFAEASINATSCEGKNDGLIDINNLSGGAGNYLFSLNNQPFSNENPFDSLGPGIFDVTIQDANGCEFSIENIEIQSGAGLNISLPTSLTLLPGDEVILTPTIDFTPISVEWNPVEDLSCGDCLEPTLIASKSGTYTIIAYADTDCFATASINISIDTTGRDAFMPSAFSPNDDGINDIFYVNAGNQIVNVKNFVVVDRWGGLMFQAKEVPPNDPLYGWDGTFRGKRMNSGVYGFFTEVEFADGSTKILEGDLTLLSDN